MDRPGIRNLQRAYIYLLKSILRIWHQTYLGSLFKLDKILFCIVLLFFFFSLLANLIRLETTPFFKWSLYSEKFQVQDTYSFHEILYNGKILNFNSTWRSPEKVIATEPLESYIVFLHGKGRDPWEVYLQDSWGKSIPGSNRSSPIYTIIHRSTTLFLNGIKNGSRPPEMKRLTKSPS